MTNKRTLLLTGLWGIMTACLQPAPTHSQTTKKNDTMNTQALTNEVVKRAIAALQEGNKEAWFALFTPEAELYDDGHKMDLQHFFNKAIGHERFISIDKVENNGLHVYGRFYTEQWGDFKTYMRFRLNASQKIDRLEIGQANY